MKLYQVIRDLDLESGGPSRSATALGDALVSNDQVTFFCLDRSNPILRPDTADLCTGSRPAITGEYDRALSGDDAVVCHFHGLWTPFFREFVSMNRNQKIPYMFSPRGMLEPWALNHKKWKKKVAWWLYQKRDLQGAACLHATADSEASQFRRLGLKNPIAVIPNGVEIPDNKSALDTNSNRGRTLLFLSRIQKKKGLLNLVAAWAKVKSPGWRIRIVGPEEDNHLEEVKRAAQQSGVLEDFSFEGPVGDDQKWDLYKEADLFVLPTFSENFGLVVAEALASGTPVITTKGAPWMELETHKCGWWVDIGVEPLAEALKEAMYLSDGQRQTMGVRGRKLIEQKYTWPQIAVQMKSVYDWVLKKGPQPDCVMTE